MPSTPQEYHTAPRRVTGAVPRCHSRCFTEFHFAQHVNLGALAFLFDILSTSTFNGFMRYKQYRDAYAAAISELETLLVKQEKLEERVLSLRKTLNVLSELCQQDGVAETDADRRYARLAKAVEGSLTDDIRKIMQSTIDGLTANEVRVELNKLGNTLAGHSNPLATVSAVLNRLLVNGEVEEGLKDGKKAWKSRTLRLSALMRAPTGRYQGRYSGNRLNSNRFNKGSK